MSNPKLKFYDVKGRKSFSSTNYTKVTKGNTRMAVAKAPSGIQAHRIIGRVKK